MFTNELAWFLYHICVQYSRSLSFIRHISTCICFALLCSCICKLIVDQGKKCCFICLFVVAVVCDWKHIIRIRTGYLFSISFFIPFLRLILFRALVFPFSLAASFGASWLQRKSWENASCLSLPLSTSWSDLKSKFYLQLNEYALAASTSLLTWCLKIEFNHTFNVSNLSSTFFVIRILNLSRFIKTSNATGSKYIFAGRFL